MGYVNIEHLFPLIGRVLKCTQLDNLLIEMIDGRACQIKTISEVITIFFNYKSFLIIKGISTLIEFYNKYRRLQQLRFIRRHIIRTT